MKKLNICCFFFIFLLSSTGWGISKKEFLDNEINKLKEYLKKAQLAEGPSCTPVALAEAQACLARAIEEFKERDFWEAEDQLTRCNQLAEGLWNDILACREDLDRDGISDYKDKCLKEPEIYNGYRDDDGCPDEMPKRALLTADKIEILESVQFDTQTQSLRAESRPVLEDVAKIMEENPDLYICVEAHMDSSLPAEETLHRTALRAEIVKEALISLGIAERRIDTKGKGAQEPIASNSSSWGRSLNQRVEFMRIK